MGDGGASCWFICCTLVRENGVALALLFSIMEHYDKSIAHLLLHTNDLDTLFDEAELAALYTCGPFSLSLLKAAIGET